MTKEELAKKYFKKKWYSRKYRYCDFLDYRNYRVNIKNYSIEAYSRLLGWGDTTWIDFNKCLKKYYENKKQEDKNNDVSKFDWSFIEEK